MKRNEGSEMGFAEEDEFHHRLISCSTPTRKLPDDYIAADHPCVPRKLRSAVKKRNHEESTSPTLSEAKKSSLRVGRIKLKKNVPKKGSRKHSTAMAAPITKEEEEVVETLNALAGIFSASSSTPQMIAIKAIDTTTTQELIIQTDENKGVLLQSFAGVLPYSTNDDKNTLPKRCATHVYLSHFIKHELQFERKEEETITAFNSQVSQKPKMDLSLSVGGGMEACGSNNNYKRSSFFDHQIQENGEQHQVQQQQFWTTHLSGHYEQRKSTFDVLRWQSGGTEPDVSPQMFCSRTARPPFPFGYDHQTPSLSSSGYQDKVTMTFLPDIPLSLQLLCGERP